MHRRTGPFLFAVWCALSSVLCPQTVAGQETVVTVFGGGGGESANAAFQIATLLGETFIGQSAGTDLTADFGFWLADDALAGASSVANETVGAVPEGSPELLTLEPNYPNPVSSRATVRFGLPEGASARLMIIDALGRIVRLASDGEGTAGWHLVSIASDDLPSGTYFLKLDAGGQSRIRPMLVVH